MSDDRITTRHWWKGTPGTAKTYVKRYSWKSWSIGLPIIWRWSPHVSISFAPASPWLVGVIVGPDDSDDWGIDIGLGPLLWVRCEVLEWLTYEAYHARMDRLEATA